MKAITIHQPWATLIALGEKKFETRSWATHYRGPIAIHAAQKVDREICLEEPFRSILAEHGYTADNLPTGVVVAVGELAWCWKVSDWLFDGETKIPYLHAGLSNKLISTMEFAFGDYTPGRYAWELANVRKIEPTPVKGRQGLWNWGGERDASRS